MRKGCLLSALAFILVACVILYATRSLQINRGLRLESYVAGEFTYDVWSYGNWTYSKQSGIQVSTFAPPYTLVLAIRPTHRDVTSIEILAVSIIDESGNRTSVLDNINQSIGDVQVRSTAAIKSPYAVVIFQSVIDSTDTTTLELEFRTNTSEGSDTTRQLLELQGFETRTRSFTFLEVMSSA